MPKVRRHCGVGGRGWDPQIDPTLNPVSTLPFFRGAPPPKSSKMANYKEKSDGDAQNLCFDMVQALFDNSESYGKVRFGDLWRWNDTFFYFFQSPKRSFVF